uniref:Uncharacterized protein n=1 Tax=Ditylenchus dipsaci TaxID=166011 RepID=A0A915CYX6_9BILA
MRKLLTRDDSQKVSNAIRNSPNTLISRNALSYRTNSVLCEGLFSESRRSFNVVFSVHLYPPEVFKDDSRMTCMVEVFIVTVAQLKYSRRMTCMVEVFKDDSGMTYVVVVSCVCHCG